VLGFRERGNSEEREYLRDLEVVDGAKVLGHLGRIVTPVHDVSHGGSERAVEAGPLRTGISPCGTEKRDRELRRRGEGGRWFGWRGVVKATAAMDRAVPGIKGTRRIRTDSKGAV